MRKAFLLLLLTGCDQAMREQPRARPYEPSPLFADGTSARPLPPGVVPRGVARDEGPPTLGRLDLQRGRERYGIYCAPCHGAAGDGDGTVALRGFPTPPSFHEERLLAASPEHIAVVIREGLGRMPPHGYLVPEDDRRRIAAYVRALQLSRRVPVDLLRPEERARLPKEGP
jgi:mono/diheme cytochrome c family protein